MRRRTRTGLLAAVPLAWATLQGGPARAASKTRPAAAGAAAADASVADYFAELSRLGLVDLRTSSEQSLREEVAAAERLLQQGALLPAAVALYAIVESPAYQDFSDSPEYQNAEYYLGVTLAGAGASGPALTYLGRTLARGPDSLYFAPAHRRAVDLALEDREPARVLAELERVAPEAAGLPPEASGERAYLRARIAYDAGRDAEAESQLVRLGPRSRLYLSALYLRGVMRARRGEFRGAAAALCEIATTPDDDQYALVVDDRYFSLKDLARLGLGRIAHEVSDYEDAYYHYFQIPQDSRELPQALFEAAWSMYQKRDLEAARGLVQEFLRTFPSSPLVPEARLLAGYVELADCQFAAAQRAFDRVLRDFTPVARHLGRLRATPRLRRALFARALARHQESDAAQTARRAAQDLDGQVLGLLRLDPGFVRLHRAVFGLRQWAADAPFVAATWHRLGRRMRQDRVRRVASELADRGDAQQLVQDHEELLAQVHQARAELDRALAQGVLAGPQASAERQRLSELTRDVRAALSRSRRFAAAQREPSAGEPRLAAMVRGDASAAGELVDAATALERRLLGAAERLSSEALRALESSTRDVIDRARLGKIDAVIGQKRRLEIEVEDLAAGRFPPELRARLWDQWQIGDDEEYWPYEGEYWADEYAGWR